MSLIINNGSESGNGGGSGGGYDISTYIIYPTNSTNPIRYYAYDISDKHINDKHEYMIVPNAPQNATTYNYSICTITNDLDQMVNNGSIITSLMGANSHPLQATMIKSSHDDGRIIINHGIDSQSPYKLKMLITSPNNFTTGSEYSFSVSWNPTPVPQAQTAKMFRYNGDLYMILFSAETDKTVCYLLKINENVNFNLSTVQQVLSFTVGGAYNHLIDVYVDESNLYFLYYDGNYFDLYLRKIDLSDYTYSTNYRLGFMLPHDTGVHYTWFSYNSPVTNEYRTSIMRYKNKAYLRFNLSQYGANFIAVLIDPEELMSTQLIDFSKCITTKAPSNFWKVSSSVVEDLGSSIIFDGENLWDFRSAYVNKQWAIVKKYIKPIIQTK